MKPRVFVSSTFYDLKHVRERIERFIENYNFEPVLFESDNVIFEHNKPLDISCYNEVKLCHIMILIIGGRYGSVISGENASEKKDSYNNEYISITRKEYESAIKMNIPVFVFIDKNVYAEYHTFKKNMTFFNNPDNDFSFAHVDDINVFKFISFIKGKAIKTFEKIEDIESYLSNQIAGMLYLYLEELQNNQNEQKVLDSVSELQSISKRMNEMLNAVGKNVIKDNLFEEVLFNQNKIVIDFFVNQFIDHIRFKTEIPELDKETAKRVYEIFKLTVFNYDKIESIEKTKDYNIESTKKSELIDELKYLLNEIDNRIQIEYFNYYKIYSSYIKKIYPIISTDQKLQDFLDEKLCYDLELELTGLPF